MHTDICTELRVQGNLATCSHMSPHLDDWISAPAASPGHCLNTPKCSPMFLSLQVTEPQVDSARRATLARAGHMLQAGA